jgi:hypothetical protein
MTKTTMKLVDETTGLMKCSKCGRTSSPMQKPDVGKVYRGSLQCPYGCKVED